MEYYLEPLQLQAASSRRTRLNAREVAQETVECCRQGWYRNTEYEEVPLPMAEAVESTRLLAADSELPALPPPRAADGKSVVSVTLASTLEAAEALAAQGLRTCVLNFASAKNPGGGFLRGAMAQEESIARSSGLYPCLLKTEVSAFYQDNRRDSSCVYTDHMIMSDGVPVFRRDDGELLEAPYRVSVLTAPAPNMGEAARRPQSGGAEAIQAIRRRRMDRVLAFLAAEAFDAVVLGAWGCGVFRNDPSEVATEFRQLLCTKYRGMFPRVVFAVYDEPTHRVFDAVLKGEQIPSGYKQSSRERNFRAPEPARPPDDEAAGKDFRQIARRERKGRRWARGGQ